LHDASWSPWVAGGYGLRGGKLLKKAAISRFSESLSCFAIAVMVSSVRCEPGLICSRRELRDLGLRAPSGQMDLDVAACIALVTMISQRFIVTFRLGNS